MHSSYAILLFCAKNHEGQPGREGLEQGGVCHDGQTEAGISLQKQIKEMLTEVYISVSDKIKWGKLCLYDFTPFYKSVMINNIKSIM